MRSRTVEQDYRLKLSSNAVYIGEIPGKESLMAYDEILATRIRRALATRVDMAERKMFGGLAFMLRGNMCCGAVGEVLMLRLGNAGAAEALAEAHTRPMDFTGKPLKSMIYVDPPGIDSDKDLYRWVNRAAEFAESLPPK